MAIDSHGDVVRDEVEQADRRYRGEPRRTSRTTGRLRHLPMATVTARCLLEYDERVIGEHTVRLNVDSERLKLWLHQEHVERIAAAMCRVDCVRSKDASSSAK